MNTLVSQVQIIPITTLKPQDGCNTRTMAHTPATISICKPIVGVRATNSPTNTPRAVYSAASGERRTGIMRRRRNSRQNRCQAPCFGWAMMTLILFQGGVLAHPFHDPAANEQGSLSYMDIPSDKSHATRTPH